MDQSRIITLMCVLESENGEKKSEVFDFTHTLALFYVP
jgi:hypothetical protein